MYRVSLTHLTLEVIIGILDFERTTPQKIEVSCDFEYQNKAKYVDYAVIKTIIESMLLSNHYLLLEDAIDEIKSEIKKKFPKIKKLRLEIKKLEIFKNCEVSIAS